MEREYKQLFASLNQSQVPIGFKSRLYKRIALVEKRRTVFRYRIFTTLAVVSGLGVIPAGYALGHAFSQSSFWYYGSLLFSDTGTFMLIWKDFLFAVAEVLPLLGITIVVAIAFIFVWALTQAVKWDRRSFISIIA